MSNVIVSGSLAYDHIMDFPDLFKNHFLADKLHNINVSFVIEAYVAHFGGTGGNIAYTLALLGENPRIVATVGKDFGHYAEYLKNNGISVDTIRIDETRATASAHIITDKGDNQITAFYPGALVTPYGEIPFGDAKLVINAPNCIEDMRALPNACRAKGIPMFFDPGQMISALQAEDLKDGINGAEVIFCNDYELAMMLQKTGWQEADITAAAKTLIVTLGAGGSRIVTSKGETRVAAAYATDLRDPTGAGDAYRAGYAKGFLAGLPSEECAKLASVAGVYAIENEGTQEHRFTMEEFKKRFEDSYGTFPLA